MVTRAVLTVMYFISVSLTSGLDTNNLMLAFR